MGVLKTFTNDLSMCNCKEKEDPFLTKSLGLDRFCIVYFVCKILINYLYIMDKRLVFKHLPTICRRSLKKDFVWLCFNNVMPSHGKRV